MFSANCLLSTVIDVMTGQLVLALCVASDPATKEIIIVIRIQLTHKVVLIGFCEGSPG